VTLAAWLQSRTPPAPPALMARVELALGGGLAADLSEVPDECLRAALSLLEPLLDRHEARRECALDLLAADALVTYGRRTRWRGSPSSHAAATTLPTRVDDRRPHPPASRGRRRLAVGGRVGSDSRAIRGRRRRDCRLHAAPRRFASEGRAPRPSRRDPRRPPGARTADTAAVAGVGDHARCTGR